MFAQKLLSGISSGHLHCTKRCTLCADTVGRNADVFRFASILNEIDGRCSIAVDGNWGSGKTFFVKQVKMVMDAYNDFIKTEDDATRNEIRVIGDAFYQREAQLRNADDECFLQPQVCVYYDAWENDNDDDPILSLVYSILRSVNTDFSFKDRSVVDIGESLLELFTELNWTQVVEALRGENPLEQLQKEKNIEQQVKEFLDALLPERGNRLVVLVDELDRCKPSYAVRMLERIKHYFENDRITFVFSVNTRELQHTIRKHYGNDFDGAKYLERFFDLRISLPEPNLDKYYQCIGFDRAHNTYDIICKEVIKNYHFELREIEKYIFINSLVRKTEVFNYYLGDAMQFCFYYIVPIMIGLKIHDENRYFDFIEGRDSKPMLDQSDALSFNFFSILLNNKETFDSRQQSLKVVTVEEKLEEVYHVLFIEKQESDMEERRVGSIGFLPSSREMILRITSLLSKYSHI